MTLNFELLKWTSFYYGFCLLFSGLVIGLLIGLRAGGFLTNYPFSIITILVMTITFVIGFYIDWKVKFVKK